MYIPTNHLTQQPETTRNNTDNTFHDRMGNRVTFRTVSRIRTRKIRVSPFQATLPWKGPWPIILKGGSGDATCCTYISGISTLFRLTNGRALVTAPLPSASYSHPFRNASTPCGESTIRHFAREQRVYNINKMHVDSPEIKKCCPRLSFSTDYQWGQQN